MIIDAPVIAVTARNKRATKSNPFIIRRVFVVEFRRGSSASSLMVDSSTQKERWVSRALTALEESQKTEDQWQFFSMKKRALVNISLAALCLRKCR